MYNLGIVMLMYNFLEYSDNYSMTSGCLWNYYRDEVNDSADKNENSFMINNNKITKSKYFERETKIIGSRPNKNNMLDAAVAPLKYLGTFWTSLDLPLINCEIELDLKWTEHCIISEISRTSIVTGNPPAQDVVTETTAAIFQINKSKLYLPVFTLSSNNNIKFLENLKEGYIRPISWNKYRSEITTQIKNNNLDAYILIYRTFRNFHSKMVMMILWKILLISFTCHLHKSKIVIGYLIIIFFDKLVKNK